MQLGIQGLVKKKNWTIFIQAFWIVQSMTVKPMLFLSQNLLGLCHYNQSVLDEYDVEVPETWDEVVALGEKMTSNSDDRVAMGFREFF